jgi:hypothetical protein
VKIIIAVVICNITATRNSIDVYMTIYIFV